MNKKIIVYIIIIMIIGVFTGCQLAVEGADSSVEPDKLIGIFVTEEYIDLFDFNAFVSDNIDEISKGEVTAAGNQYEGKAYGTFNPDNPYDVVFPGYEGVVFISNTYEKDGVTHSGVGSGNQITEVHMYVNDEGERIEGKIYANSSKSIISTYMNPIYKTAEGEIYFVSGTGISMDGGYSGSMSQSMSEEYKVREGNEEVTESFEVEVAVECVFGAEYYLFKQIDKNDNVISETKIYSDDIPESIELNGETEYIILEKVGKNNQGIRASERSIINDETYFNIFFFNDSIFAEHYAVQIDKD